MWKKRKGRGRGVTVGRGGGGFLRRGMSAGSPSCHKDISLFASIVPPFTETINFHLLSVSILLSLNILLTLMIVVHWVGPTDLCRSKCTKKNFIRTTLHLHRTSRTCRPRRTSHFTHTLCPSRTGGYHRTHRGPLLGEHGLPYYSLSCANAAVDTL